MSILIVSNNPLFKEIIIATVAQFRLEVMELNPEEALSKVCELRPDVIIIDETILSSQFEDLLSKARSLQKTRLIVLNPTQNEMTLLDSRRATLNKANDLLEAISNYGYEIQAENADCKVVNASKTEKKDN